MAIQIVCSFCGRKEFQCGEDREDPPSCFSCRDTSYYAFARLGKAGNALKQEIKKAMNTEDRFTLMVTAGLIVLGLVCAYVAWSIAQ